MKHLKTKLFSALTMLVVAAIMMVSSTYAWFTISANPEISDIKANVTANGNFEIALDAGKFIEPSSSTYKDAGKNETWGNLIDLEGAFSKDATSSNAIVLKPVAIKSAAILSSSANSSAAFQYPVYGKDGRISELKDLYRVQCSDGIKDNFNDFGGVWFYTTSSATSIDSASAGMSDIVDNEIYAVEIDYWFRTNVDSSAITLLSSSSTETRSADSSATLSSATYAGETGLGSYITIDTVTILISDPTDGKVFEATYDETDSSAVKKSLTLKEVEWNADKETYEVKTGGQNYIVLKENTAKLIKMFIFMDGATVENKDAKLTMTEFEINVQFTSDQTLDTMDVPQNDYDRASANSSAIAD